MVSLIGKSQLYTPLDIITFPVVYSSSIQKAFCVKLRSMIYQLVDRSMKRCVLCRHFSLSNNTAKVGWVQLSARTSLKYVTNLISVCPANWHPGGATIKPNVKESKVYFDKAGTQ
jgi:hypothetical protein